MCFRQTLRCALLNWGIRAASPLAFLLLPPPSSAPPALSHNYCIVAGNELQFQLFPRMSMSGHLLFRIAVGSHSVNSVVFAFVSAMLVVGGLKCLYIVWGAFDLVSLADSS